MMAHAIRIHAYSGPDAMQWDDVRTPEPGPVEVLVQPKMTACLTISHEQRRAGGVFA